MLEKTGLILVVGAWAMRRAVDDIARWQAMGLQAPRVAVNVSPIQLRDKGFVGRVIDVLSRFGDSAPLLDIEITESVIMENVQQSSLTLQTLRGAGVRVSIDDFGTGYSSLAYLTRLPVNEVKIDRVFISGMGDSADGVAIVQTIISLAHSLHLKVVAEGVETEAQATILRGLKCDFMQGYLFCEPVSFDRLAGMLAKRVH
jgi:EAL domain-containing protein (putative c-di-GMP-specific phosphodiesterase class I)